MISVEIRVKYFLVAFTNIHQITPPTLKYVKKIISRLFLFNPHFPATKKAAPYGAAKLLVIARLHERFNQSH